MQFDDLIKKTALNKIKFTSFEFVLNEIYEEATIESKLGGGIYRFYDESNTIIYVGKSNDLYRRFHQHLGRRTNSDYFIDQVRRIEYYVENSPVLQTMLEGIFIAWHKPKFNDEVKDEAKQRGE